MWEGFWICMKLLAAIVITGLVCLAYVMATNEEES